MNKHLTSSIYSFEDLINGNFLYVDKTEFVWKLLKPSKELYFLSRPRRFGKSLLLSTLKAIFEGKRELFKGLALAGKPYEWKIHPVIHLDMNGRDFRTVAKMEESFKSIIREQADMNKVALTETSPEGMFHELIKTLHDNSGDVVLLLDEYDKPILNNIAKENRYDFLEALKVFYSVIKEKASMLRLAFITGVSKFSHVSIFSDLNNLTDITLKPEYADMLGFTEAEIRQYFADRIPLAAKTNGCSEEELMRTLLTWYDGYRFSDEETHVCNPVSLSSFFSNNYKFTNYWDSTGTPSFLLKVARESDYDYEAALTRFYSESIFSAYELDRLDITGLLWQTGYLTIKEVRTDTDGLQYRLDFPDKEVQETFSRKLIEFLVGSVKGDEASYLAHEFRAAIRKDDLNGFMTLFQSFLATISYDIHHPHEKYYQTIFFIVFKLLGASIEAESRTNEGRIDAYIRTAKKIYIFEFKLNKKLVKAVSQIMDRHYYERFQACGQPIVMVGVNFNSKKGRIDNWAETTLAARIS